MAAKFEIYEDARGEWRFRLKAANGYVMANIWSRQQRPSDPLQAAVS